MPDLDIKLNNTLKQIIMKKIIIITLVFCVTNTFAQKETVTIITSAECVLDCCKDRIEKEMQFAIREGGQTVGAGKVTKIIE